MAEKFEVMPVAGVVLDYSIYPRHTVNDWHVAQLVESLHAGAEMPPIVIEWGTSRVVDGFHRVIAVKRVHGEGSSIAAVVREYPSEAALFEEAMLLNVRHGRSLTSMDRVRSILLARSLGIDDLVTANRLQMTPEKLGELVFTRTAINPNEQLVPIKLTAAAMVAGRTMSSKQEVGNKAAGGQRIGFYAGQVANAIENDLVDWEDLALVAKLDALRGLLEKALARQMVAA